jgi:hypothetical protein
MPKLFETMREEAFFAAGQLSGVVEQTDADRILNSALREVHDMLTQAVEDYQLTTSAELTVAGGADYVALPTDVYKVRGVDRKIGTSWQTMDRHEFGDRNKTSGPLTYTVAGSRLYFAPVAQAPGAIVRVLYTPVFTDLSDGGSFDGINGFEELAVVEAAIRMRDAEESDVQVLMARKAALMERVNMMAQRRDRGRPHKARDVRGTNWRGARWRGPDQGEF